MKKLLLPFILLVCTLVASSPSISQETYDNKTLGIIVVKPETWVFLTDKQNRENIARTQMSDAEFQKYVETRSRAPIFAITKYPEPYDDLNPSLKIVVRPAGNLKDKDLQNVADQLLDFTADKMGSVVSIRHSEITEIDGYPAAFGEIDYTLKTKDGREFPTTSRMWFVLKDELMILIGVGMNTDETAEVRNEIDMVVQSIQLK